jgi:hypothetical protein
LVDFHEIWQAGDATESPRLNIFNTLASIVPKWQTFKILRRMQYLHYSALLNNGLRRVSIADVNIKTNAHGLLQSKEDINALLALSMSFGDVTMETKECSLLRAKRA